MLKKGLGAVFAPYRHTLRQAAKTQNLTIFTTEPAKQNFECAIWVHILTQALFLKIFGFFEENRTFFIPLSPLHEKNSMIYVGSKLASKSAQSPI